MDHAFVLCPLVQRTIRNGGDKNRQGSARGEAGPDSNSLRLGTGAPGSSKVSEQDISEVSGNVYCAVYVRYEN